MSKIVKSKMHKGDLKDFDNKKTDFFMRCRFKTHFLTIGSSDGPMELVKEMKDKKTNNVQNPLTKPKLKFQCHYEERNRRAEFRRKKIIQKLKKVYRINVDDLNENVTNEIIRKVEIIEKEKKEKEKRNVEKTLNMINRLLQEQNYKRKAVTFHPPPWRRKAKDVQTNETVCASENKKEILSEERKEEEEEENEEGSEINKQIEIEEPEELERTKSSKKLSGDEENVKEKICAEEKKLEKVGHDVGILEKTLETFKLARLCAICPKSAPLETSLACTPERVVFEDYEKGRVYIQNLKITNVGLEIVHCRYLGIAVKDKSEKRFPIGVAVRDNVKLSPGLSCSTKIRLCCQDTTDELECSIVYETRRQNKPLQHSCFLVPVVCYPARALIKVTPHKIIFPTLTWCSAFGPQGDQLLRKIIKIENTGGKGCSCRISDESNESYEEENLEEDNEEEEGERERSEFQGEATVKSNSEKEKGDESEKSPAGGDSLKSFKKEENGSAKELVNELVQNVFANFRFSDKYHIEIGPHSVKQIEVRFTPEYRGFHHEIIHLHFEGCHNCVEESIELMGDIKRLPLSSEPQVIDLKTCVANSGVYSGIFRVFNNSKGPHPVKLKIPSCMRNHAHVQPKATVIQSNGFCDFSVRFYPRITLANDAPQYFSRESGILEFPVFVYSTSVGDCTSDCLTIHVFALITDYCLELSPPEINFGTVTTLETVRTRLQLTNHSLAIQEYGFLNLPKGVRVEPNMGFGRILPKESISLYLLYSPVEDVIKSKTGQEIHSFRLRVTSLAEFGGFREKLTLEDDKLKPFESILGEYDYYEFENTEGESVKDENKNEMENEIQPEEKDESSEVCGEEEDDSSIEEEDFTVKINDKKVKIRKYLKEDTDKMSGHSFFKRIGETQRRQSEEKGSDNREKTSSQNNGTIPTIEECDEEEYDDDHDEIFTNPMTLREDYNVVKCEALVIDPLCQISESVIQLPATPCSSFSLYRFRLNGAKGSSGDACTCGLKESKKNPARMVKPKFEAAFEFQISCPQIKLEPQSGFLKAGESLPITIIYRPEFPAEELKYESKIQKSKKLVEEKKSDRDNPSSGPGSVPLSKQKGKQNSTTKFKGQADGIEADSLVKSIELDKYDLFAAEKSLQKLTEPFCVKTRLQCVVRTVLRVGKIQRTEIHEMILICPAVKPNFIYLGESQQINFGKVFTGTAPKILLEIQNISLKRIVPVISLLNPVGSFSCPAGLRKVEVDPEHVWRQPLTYSPLTARGIEREYFEIHCGTTNLFLTVFGEGIEPQYSFTPDFSCCLIETKIGTVEEIKIDIENLDAKPFKVQIVTDFLKEGLEAKPEDEAELVEGSAKKETKKEKTSGNESSKDKKKGKNASSGLRNVRTWDQIPDFILSQLENFTLVGDQDEPASKVFSLNTGDENNEVTISPNSKFPLRIRFSPQANAQDKPDFQKVYAIKYNFLLERISLLKEVLVIGKISKAT